jgi:RNA polymerase sigma-70 factor, ECF subfamily
MYIDFFRKKNIVAIANPDNLKDEELVVYIREKNKDAYSFVINRYSEKIRRYVNRLINNPDEAEDLTQQALVNAYINLNSFNKNKRFSPWIYRIAHNLAVNWIKRKKAQISLDRNEVVASKLASKIDVMEDVSGVDFNEKFTVLLNKLPKKFKEPFMLKYIEDKTYDEISTILRMPKNTVGTMVNRAKKILKKELEKKNYGK